MCAAHPPSFALQEVFPQADHTALDTSDRQSPDSAVRTVMNTRTGATSPAFTTTLSGISTTRSSVQGLAAGQSGIRSSAGARPLLLDPFRRNPRHGRLLTPAERELGECLRRRFRFAYAKAAESTYYTNPYFAQQYNGSSQFCTLPLHLASYSTVVDAIPAGWSSYSMWQFTNSGPFVGDSNFFLGTVNDLKALAKNPNAVHRNRVNGQDRAAWNLPKSASGTKRRGIYSTIKRTYKNERHLAEVPLVLSLRDASFEQHKNQDVLCSG